jgi:hypothetical protein
MADMVTSRSVCLDRVQDSVRVMNEFTDVGVQFFSRAKLRRWGMVSRESIAL